MQSVTQILREGFECQNGSLRPLMLLAGLSLSQTLDLLQISKVTFYRWERIQQPDPVASKLLSIYAGYLPWPAWRGWEMHRNRLFRPGQERHGLSTSEIENLVLAYQYRDLLIEENQKLQDQLDEYRSRERAPVFHLVK